MKTKPKIKPKYLKTTGREIIPAPNIVLPICKKAPKNVVEPLEYFGLILSSSDNISSDCFSFSFSSVSGNVSSLLVSGSFI